MPTILTSRGIRTPRPNNVCIHRPATPPGVLAPPKATPPPPPRMPLHRLIRPHREHVAAAAEIRQRILIAAHASLHRGRLALQADEAHSPRAQPQQVLRRQIARAMVVDA